MFFGGELAVRFREGIEDWFLKAGAPHEQKTSPPPSLVDPSTGGLQIPTNWWIFKEKPGNPHVLYIYIY